MTDRLAEAARNLLGYLQSGVPVNPADGPLLEHELGEALAEFDAQGPDALEEKAAALDWLLDKLQTAYGLDIDMTTRYLLRSRDMYSNREIIGTGPTPLAAVLDAMGKEVKPC